jgi:hypothetical protein
VPAFNLAVNGPITINSMNDVEDAARRVADEARDQAYQQARQYFANMLNGAGARLAPTIVGARRG